MIEELEAELTQQKNRIKELEVLIHNQKTKEIYEEVEKNKVIFLYSKNTPKFGGIYKYAPRLQIEEIDISVIYSQELYKFSPIAITYDRTDCYVGSLTITSETFKNNYNTLIERDIHFKGKWYDMVYPYIINNLTQNPITIYTVCQHGKLTNIYLDIDSYNRGFRCRIHDVKGNIYHLKEDISFIEVYTMVVFDPNNI